MNDYARSRIRDRISYPSKNYPHYGRPDEDDYVEYKERDYRTHEPYYDAYRESQHDMRDMEYRRPYRESYIYSDNARRAVTRHRATGDYNVDYAMAEKRLSRSDIEHWKKHIQNEDGTTGYHFSREEVELAAKNANINIERFGKEDFCMTMNMLYSDYCATAKKYGISRPEFYAELAKNFLDDKDFDGDGKEKLMLYYKCIVEKDDE